MKSSNVQLQARKALLKQGVWTLLEQGKSLEIVLARLVENIEGQADEMLAAVFLYDPTRDDLTIGAAPNLQPVYKKAVNGFKCGPDQPACGSAAFKRQQVIAVDVMTDPLWKDLREITEAIGVRAVWSQPILSGDGAVLGTIAFYFSERKAPSSADDMILEASANIAAEIIQARMDQAKALTNSQKQLPNTRHQCMIYDGAPSLQLPVIASVVRGKLVEGYRCLYLNRPVMVSGLRSALAALGVDVAREVAEDRLQLSSDSHENSDGAFNVDGMLGLLEEALDQSIADGLKGLFATGDMTWEFGAEKNFSKLMEYELRLEKIFRRRTELCGICQYHKDSLPIEATKQGVLTHSTIFINDTLSRANPCFGGAKDAELDELIAELCQLS